MLPQLATLYFAERQVDHKSAGNRHSDVFLSTLNATMLGSRKVEEKCCPYSRVPLIYKKKNNQVVQKFLKYAYLTNWLLGAAGTNLPTLDYSLCAKKLNYALCFSNNDPSNQAARLRWLDIGLILILCAEFRGPPLVDIDFWLLVTWSHDVIYLTLVFPVYMFLLCWWIELWNSGLNSAGITLASCKSEHGINSIHSLFAC